MEKTAQVNFEAIAKIAKRIVERFHPQRVILFGSQARGEAHEGSDIDLCVVMETGSKSPQEIARQIEQAIAPLALTIRWHDRPIRIPCQVHVFSPEEFEAALLRAGVFVTTMAREGVVLYEAEGITPLEELLKRQKPWEGVGKKPETKEWVTLAEGDWMAAQWQSQAPSPVPHVICFLAQQCAEKYLKAFLEEHNISFPRTHNLAELLDLSGGLLSELDPLRTALDELSRHGILPRYPGTTLTPQQVANALRTAEQVRAIIRAKLGLP
jgi:HEPN domain-containing protein/predicted nucleotidyltransferase